MTGWSDERLARLMAIRQMIARLEDLNRQNSVEIAELRDRYQLLEADFMTSEIDKLEKMWNNLENGNKDEPKAPNDLP